MERIGSQWKKGNHSRVYHRRLRRNVMTRNKTRVLGMGKSGILRYLVHTVAKPKINQTWELGDEEKKETEKFLGFFLG